MKASDIREQTNEELQQLYAEIKRKICDTRLKKSTADGSENPLKIRGLRRDLARINTVITERAAKVEV